MAVTVPGHGPLNAKIVIVGEAPGAEEVTYGLPFVGASGKLLTKMLTDVGIDRSACYLTNVVKIRPPNNDFGVFYEDAKRSQPSAFLRESIASLKKEIAAIGPNVIICLGAEALSAISDRRGIRSWRGSILSSPCGKCIATYHPAAVLRQWTLKPVAELDLKRAKEESTSRELNLPKMDFILDPSFEQIISFLSREPKRIAFDIETTGPMTRCIGISDRPNSAICIPLISSHRSVKPGSTRLFLAPEGAPSQNSHWPPEQEYKILEALDKYFRNPKIEKCGQNIPFDTVILGREFGFDFPNLTFDTMVAQHTCYPELEKGLDFLASIYTRVPYYSDYDVTNDQQTWIYNCYDCAVTFEIWARLEQELKELGLDEFYRNHVHPTLLAVTRAETRGILVDAKLKDEEAKTVRAEADQLEKEIQIATGSPSFNPRSPDQMKTYLYTVLGLPTQYRTDPKTKRRIPTTDKHSLDKLQKQFPQHQAFIQKCLEYSQRRDILSDFLDKPLGSDGKFRTHYSVAGTVTGRLSASKPLFEEGMNLQNQRKGKSRRMYIARPGWSLIKVDLMSAEFRAVMWIGGIRRLIDRFLADPFFDCHTWFASTAFNVPEDQVERKRADGKLSQRDRAKNGIYGGNYRMQADKAALVYKIPLEEATFILNTYRNKALPEIKTHYWDRIERMIQTTRTRINPFGRMRIFFDRIGDDLFRAAYSDFPQSMVGDIINRAFATLDDMLPESECRPLLQVHDEIVFECMTCRVDYYAPIIRRVFEYPIFFEHVPEPLVIPAEVSFGPNWYDQKEIHRTEPVATSWPGIELMRKGASGS
jgi:DNA polymerase